MDSPRGRPGRTPGSVKPIAAALAVALMGMGGVALAAPKADPSAPEQGNGPAPQAQANAPAPQGNEPAAQAQDGPASQAKAPAPQAQGSAPPPQAKAKGRQSPPAGVPAAEPQGGNAPPPGTGQAGPRYHGRPAAGEVRGHGRSISGRGNCQAAKCRGAAPKPEAGASGEQPPPAAGQQDQSDGGAAPGGGSKGRPHRERPASDPVEDQSGGAEAGAVLGANQGGGEAVEADPSSFDTALPFTGSEVLMLAGIGALLWLAGLGLRRRTA